MKLVLYILTWLMHGIACTQSNDSSFIGDPPSRPEILSGGFIDVVQNGQMNASARLFRLYIGEPGKFQLPLSVYAGVSANNFSNDPGQGDILLSLLNPETGVFNMCLDGNTRMIGSRRKVTALHLQYQSGIRFLSVFSQSSYNNVTFFNFISGAGCTFSTGAWEKNKAGNLGIFWLNLRFLYSNTPPGALSSLFSSFDLRHLFGYSAGTGIALSQVLNVKVFCFRYLNHQDAAAFRESFVGLSVNYSM